VQPDAGAVPRPEESACWPRSCPRARYLTFTFDEGIDKVVFDLRAVRKRDDNLRGVQAVYRAAGQWYLRDASEQDELVFCRGRQAERVTGLILILCSAQLDHGQPNAETSGVITIDTRGVCVPEWRGFVECTWNASGPGDGRGAEVWLEIGNYVSQGTTRVEETLIHDEEAGSFYTLERTVTTSSHYQWRVEYSPPSTDVSYTAWEQRVEDKQASHTATYERDPDCPPINCSSMPRRIHLRSSDEAEPVFVFDGTVFANIGTFVSVYSAYYVPGSLGRLQGHVAEVRTDEDEHSISLSCPSVPIELHLSEDHRTLSGTYQDATHSCRAEYRYE
jgi:hypothetical protein